MDPVSAEARLKELHAQAIQNGRGDHAKLLLWELRMLLDSEGRIRDSLRITLALARDCPSASTLTSLGHSLTRYRWLCFARHFFERALEFPDTEHVSVKWHEHAMAGIKHLDARKRG